MQSNLMYHLNSRKLSAEQEINPLPIMHEQWFLHQPTPATLLYAVAVKQIPTTDYLQRSEYDKTLAQTVSAHGGIVLQVQHNMLAALFVQNGHHDAAHQAVCTALALIDQTMMANQIRMAAGSTTLRLGIGISTGLVSLEKNGGSWNLADKASWQMFEAARQLGDLNQQAPFPTAFISHETLGALSPAHNWHIEHLGPVYLPNQGTAQPIHAVMHAVRLQ